MTSEQRPYPMGVEMTEQAYTDAVREGASRLQQVGWLGPYGIVPGGMDVDPVVGWAPIFAVEKDH